MRKKILPKTKIWKSLKMMKLMPTEASTRSSSRITRKIKTCQKILMFQKIAKVRNHKLRPLNPNPQSNRNPCQRNNHRKMKLQRKRMTSRNLMFYQYLRCHSKTSRKRLQLALRWWLMMRNLNLFPNPREVPLAQRSSLGLKEKVLPPREGEVEEVEEDALVSHHVPPWWKIKPMNLLLALFQLNPEEVVAKNQKYPLPKRLFMRRKRNLSYQF